MEYLLFGIIALLIILIGYLDRSSRQEREKLEMMIMSRDVHEYKGVIEPPAPPMKEPKEEYLDPEDVNPRTLLTAKDNL